MIYYYIIIIQKINNNNNNNNDFVSQIMTVPQMNVECQPVQNKYSNEYQNNGDKATSKPIP